MKPDGLHRIVLIVLLATLSLVLIRTAWMCDDAYITFRVIDNWANGYGLRWNVSERVQVFTHPLWMLTVAALHYFTREIYYTTLFLSMLLTIAAVCLFLYRIAKTKASAYLIGLVLLFSKAFVEYGTSGLETPLSYFLLALFYWRYLSGVRSIRDLLVISLLAALITLNRMDAVLLCLPAYLHVCYRMKSVRALNIAAVGWAPFVLWELFSLFYYGFLLPNTAYAKLFHGLGLIYLLQNSMYYISNSIQQDPITFCVIALGLIYACFSKDSLLKMIAFGVFLYLLYLVKIGGDFMSGRLFSLPLVGALAIISGLHITFKSWKFASSVLVVIVLGFMAPHPVLFSSSEYGLTEARRDHHDIADERADYYPRTGFLRFIGQPFRAGWIVRYLNNTRRNEGDIITQGNMGFMGYYGGPNIHFVDVYGLTDPLLARLPARQDCHQRPGHYFRVLPVGYVETIREGENVLRDSDLGQFYQKIAVITQGPLVSIERFKTILFMNLGYYQRLIDREHYMSKPKRVFALNEVSVRVPDGAGWGHEDAHIFTSGWITIQLETPQYCPRLEICLDSSDLYAIQYWLNDALVAEAPVSHAEEPGYGMASCIVETPEPARKAGFDEVRVIPLEGDGIFSMGHFILINE